MNPLNLWTANRTDRYPHNTQQTQATNMRTLSGTRTRDNSNPVATDIGLFNSRPQGLALYSHKKVKVKVILLQAQYGSDGG